MTDDSPTRDSPPESPRRRGGRSPTPEQEQPSRADAEQPVGANEGGKSAENGDQPRDRSDANPAHSAEGESESLGGNLYVANLSYRAETPELEAAFSKYGKVTSCQIQRLPNRESRGFGFVNMEDAKAADAAIEGLNKTMLHDRAMNVERSRRSKPHPKTPGAYLGPRAVSTKYGPGADRDDRGGYRGPGGGRGGYGGGYRGHDDRGGPRGEPYQDRGYGGRDRYGGGGYPDRDRGGYHEDRGRDRYGGGSGGGGYDPRERERYYGGGGPGPGYDDRGYYGGRERGPMGYEREPPMRGGYDHGYERADRYGGYEGDRYGGGREYDRRPAGYGGGGGGYGGGGGGGGFGGGGGYDDRGYGGRGGGGGGPGAADARARGPARGYYEDARQF